MKITKITRLPAPAPESAKTPEPETPRTPASIPEPEPAKITAPDWTAKNAADLLSRITLIENELEKAVGGDDTADLLRAWAETKAIREFCRETIQQKTAAKTGRAATLSICRAILKNASRDNLKYPHTDKDGNQHFSDGYRDLCLYTPLEGFPALPENLEPFDFDRLYPAENGEPLELPDAKALRAWIKTEKACTKTAKTHYPAAKYPIYNFGPDLPAVNAEYLLAMLEALPGCTAEFVYKYPKNTQIIIFRAENGKALLSPVYKQRGVKDELPKTDLSADQAAQNRVQA